MIELGKTLREAREQKGYTVSQLADMTHILPQIIDNLEREDFSKIVAPIYGRGFVKLYCEAVGLDSKPMVDEFMSIYTGARPPVIRMREGEDELAAEAKEVAPAMAAAPSEPEPEPVDAPPPAMPLFARTTSVRQQEESAPFSRTTSVQTQEGAVPTEIEEPVKPERFAKARDYRLPGYSMTEVPKRYWRFAVLLIAAVAIVALLAIGTRALYRATMQAPAGEGGVVVEQQAYDNKDEAGQQAYDNKKDAAQKKVPRKGVKIPPLYID